MTRFRSFPWAKKLGLIAASAVLSGGCGGESNEGAAPDATADTTAIKPPPGATV